MFKKPDTASPLWRRRESIKALSFYANFVDKETEMERGAIENYISYDMLRNV